MVFLRKLLGILVIIAGILGLVLSLAGLVGVWASRPTIASFLDATIQTLNSSITVSQDTMKITAEALGATVDSVDALSVMLSATAMSIEDSQPVMSNLNEFMGVKLPATMEAASNSLQAAQRGADVLDSAIRSLDSFRSVMSAVPLVGAFIEQPAQSYDPEVPLSESLGEIAVQLESLPDMFVEMSADLDKADDNLVTIQTSLMTMSDSVITISSSLSEYETMVIQSKSSMDNLKTMLSNIQNNLDNILNTTAIVLSLVFFWLLAAQVVILSQGWELFQGTAGRMESGVAPEIEEVVAEVQAEDKSDAS